MQCPTCGHGDSKVTDSRTADGAIRRRRACLACGWRFTTFERVGVAGVLVAKRDGRREEFSREKLLAGMRQACAKRPIDSLALQGAVDRIVVAVQGMGRSEVPSAQIGDLAMDALRGLDPIAYVRFACVYRAFADIGALQDAIDELRLQSPLSGCAESQPQFAAPDDLPMQEPAISV